MLPAEKLLMASSFFVNSFKRKDDLIARFLNFSDDPVDSLPEDKQDMLRAFKLLIHAEIEDYIETVTIDVISKCKAAWIQTYKLNPVLLRLMIYNLTAYTGNTRDNLPVDRITNIIENALREIGSNNGVKEKDLLKMMQQIGVNVMADHNTLSSDLDSYGVGRGLIAHKGVTVITTTSNPLIRREEVRRIEQIFEAMWALDADAIRLSGLVIFPVTCSQMVGI